MKGATYVERKRKWLAKQNCEMVYSKNVEGYVEKSGLEYKLRMTS